MNTKADIALADFVQNLDDFLIACDSLEQSGAWDVKKLGPAAAYFEADLFGLVLQVMSADGVFEHAEAEVLNTMFSSSYTPRQLSEMYKSLKPTISRYTDKDADDALDFLGKIDSELRDNYRDLLLEACRIVSLSDGVAEKSERMLIAKVREALA